MNKRELFEAHYRTMPSNCEFQVENLNLQLVLMIVLDIRDRRVQELMEGIEKLTPCGKCQMCLHEAELHEQEQIDIANNFVPSEA